MRALILLGAACAAPGTDREAVAVTRDFVAPGTVLEQDHLWLILRPAANVAEGTEGNPQQLEGRVVLEPLLPDAHVRVERLAPPRAAPALSALVPSGAVSVRIERTFPSATPKAMDLVDVVRVRDGRACVVAEGAPVLAVEQDDGTLQMDPRVTEPFTAVHLAVPRADAGLLGDAPKEALELWTRNAVDAAPLPADLPRCTRQQAEGP